MHGEVIDLRVGERMTFKFASKLMARVNVIFSNQRIEDHKLLESRSLPFPGPSNGNRFPHTLNDVPHGTFNKPAPEKLVNTGGYFIERIR